MRIKPRREELGLTREQLANKARITTAYVSQLEAGKRTNPSLAVLNRLAKALGAPIADLLQDHTTVLGWAAEIRRAAPVFRTREEAESAARKIGSGHVWQVLERGAVPRSRGPYPVRAYKTKRPRVAGMAPS